MLNVSAQESHDDEDPQFNPSVQHTPSFCFFISEPITWFKVYLKEKIKIVEKLLKREIRDLTARPRATGVLVEESSRPLWGRGCSGGTCTQGSYRKGKTISSWRE